LSIHFVILTK